MTSTMSERFVPVWHHRKRVLWSLLAGMLLAGVLYVVVPREWEAVCEIQIGQVGQFVLSGQGAVTVIPVPIESIPVAVERLSSPSFVKAVARRAAHTESTVNLLPKKFGGKGRLEIRQSLSSDLLVLRVRADSLELAQRLGDEIATELIEQHAQIAKPLISALEPALPKLISDIKMGEVTIERAQLLSALMAPTSRPTRLIGSVDTLSEPVFPRKMYFVALGLLFSIAIAAGLIAVKGRR